MEDLLEPDLIRWWRRRQKDRVRFEIAERHGVCIERVVVVEVNRRLVVRIKPVQMSLPLVR